MTASTKKTQSKGERVRHAAQHVYEAAQRLQAVVNNPDKIDSLFIRIVVYATLIPISVFLWRNIRPYSTYMNNLLGLDAASGLPFIAVLCGGLTFVLVQYLEVWPWLLPRDADNRKRALRNAIAIGAYSVDVISCIVFWPLTKASAPEGINIMLVRFIDWGNVATTAITIFGLAGWFALRQWVRRAA